MSPSQKSSKGGEFPKYISFLSFSGDAQPDYTILGPNMCSECCAYTYIYTQIYPGRVCVYSIRTHIYSNTYLLHHGISEIVQQTTHDDLGVARQPF